MRKWGFDKKSHNCKIYSKSNFHFLQQFRNCLDKKCTIYGMIISQKFKNSRTSIFCNLYKHNCAENLSLLNNFSKNDVETLEVKQKTRH